MTGDGQLVQLLRFLGVLLEEYEAVAKVHAVARRADGTVEAAVDPREDGRAGVVTTAPP